MTSLSYRLPAGRPDEISTRKPDHAARDKALADPVQAPADAFMHDGKLNLGPAIMLATLLSLVCWGSVFGIGYMLLH